MNTKRVKLRRLTQEEVEKLGTDDLIFVTADNEVVQGTDVLARAYLTRPGLDFEGGFFDVETEFGSKHIVGPGPDEVGIYVADDEGQEMLVLESAGLYVNVALFIPDADSEGLYQLYDAIRKRFGEGVVQKWHEESSLVPDTTFDVYEVTTRGRKGADGPKRTLVEAEVYQQRVPFVPISDGCRRDVQPHQEPEKKIATI